MSSPCYCNRFRLQQMLQKTDGCRLPWNLGSTVPGVWLPQRRAGRGLLLLA